jgi:hypothetical protein
MMTNMSGNQSLLVRIGRMRRAFAKKRSGQLQNAQFGYQGGPLEAKQVCRQRLVAIRHWERLIYQAPLKRRHYLGEIDSTHRHGKLLHRLRHIHPPSFGRQLDITTAFSTIFSSCRTLPGHEYQVSCSSVSLYISLGAMPSDLQILATKWRAS